MKTPEEYLNKITQWAKSQNTITALALVGSHARKAARPDSDIDLLFLCDDKSVLLNELSWINRLGKVDKLSREEWGIVTSIRIFYKDGREIEFGIAPLSWANIPADPGTQRVVSDRMIILKDTNHLLENLKKTAK